MALRVILVAIVAFASAGPVSADGLADKLLAADTTDEAAIAIAREISSSSPDAATLRTSDVATLSPVRRAAVYFALGEWRDAAAVELLVADIAFRPPVFADGNFPHSQQPIPWWEYPAAEALGKIGLRAVPYVVDVLAVTDDAEVRRVASFTLRLIAVGWVGNDANTLGHPDRLVAFFLESRLQREPDSAKRWRLTDALAGLHPSAAHKASTQPADAAPPATPAEGGRLP